jgi:integrase/recombinase XerD
MLANPRTRRGKGELWAVKDRYLCWMIATNFGDFTIKGHHHELLRFFAYLEGRGIERIADATHEVLQGYAFEIRKPKNGLPAPLLYVHTRLMILRQFLKWVVGQGLVLTDPAEELELPKLPQRLPHTVLSQKEARRILDAPDLRSPVGYRDRALLELLYGTGIRSRELMRLKIADVDFKNLTIFIRQGKCHKDRITPIPKVAADFVAEYVEKVRPRFAKNIKGEDDGTLFLNWTGARLDINRLLEIIKRNAKGAGIPKRVTALTFRHSLATALLENGLPLRYIQETLGHQNVASTETYAKCTLTGLRRAFNSAFPTDRRSSRTTAED